MKYTNYISLNSCLDMFHILIIIKKYIMNNIKFNLECSGMKVIFNVFLLVVLRILKRILLSSILPFI